MKSFQRTLLSLCIAAGIHGTSHADTVMKVTLLGTASATTLNGERFGMATLVDAGSQHLLFDAGRGALMRMHEAGEPLADLSGIFITHLHSDHIAGLPDIYATGSLPMTQGLGRKDALALWGPKGIDQVAAGIQTMFGPNNAIRLKDHEIAPAATHIVVHDVDHDGVVYDRDGVKVTAFLVDHGNAKPAYGYRVDYRGHSVVISGDTRYTPNLVAHAQHVDLLVHCVAIASPALQQAEPDKIAHFYHYLASPSAVDRVFNETRPTLAVLSHISFFSRADIPAVSQNGLEDAVRSGYAGSFLIGQDLQSFDITDNGQVTPVNPA
jgi:ribonuclease Z